MSYGEIARTGENVQRGDVTKNRATHVIFLIVSPIFCTRFVLTYIFEMILNNKPNNNNSVSFEL